MFQRLKRVPLHWKLLLGGQFVITLGLVQHRLANINRLKADKAARRLAEQQSLASQPEGVIQGKETEAVSITNSIDADTDTKKGEGRSN